MSSLVRPEEKEITSLSTTKRHDFSVWWEDWRTSQGRDYEGCPGRKWLCTNVDLERCQGKEIF